LRDGLTRLRKVAEFTYWKGSDIPYEITRTTKYIDFLHFYLCERNLTKYLCLQLKIILYIWVVTKFRFAIVLLPLLLVSSQLLKSSTGLNKFVPVMQCLMRTRSIGPYHRVMSKMIEQNSKMTLECRIFNYKQAIYKSTKKAFPNANLGFWLFYLSQILWRRIQTIKLVKYYDKNADFEFYSRSILALAFVLTKRVMYMRIFE
jgi:hypothetical protein